MSDSETVQDRMETLTEEHEDLLGYVLSDMTDDGAYFLALRTWPHPDEADTTTVSLRYAYLTRTDGSDGWIDSGVNMRVPDDRLESFMQSLSDLFLRGLPRLDNDDAEPWTGNAMGD